MLFDSDINVYEDSNVAVPEAAEFNIRGRHLKVQTEKDKKKLTSDRELRIKKQKILAEQKAKLLIEDMPASMVKGFSNFFKNKTDLND